jgi:hypothetical protein
LAATINSLGIAALPGNLDFADADIHGDVAAYASELAGSGLALGFNVQLDASRALPATIPVTREFNPGG